MVDDGNSLKIPYQSYQVRELKRACKDLPVERRQALLENIQARANILGVANKAALDSVLKNLKEAKK